MENGRFIHHRWYAGASVEFETNKGRVMSFHPYLATRQADQVVTMRAEQGKEIIMLQIKYRKEVLTPSPILHT